MKIPKLTLNQVLLVGVFLALVVNTIVHFTSPAYRYYKQNLEHLQNGVNDFERKVALQFVPAVLALTNSLGRSDTVATNSFSVVAGTSLPLLSQTNSPSLFNLDFKFFTVGGQMGFSCDGVNYFEGDSFFGSSIRLVTPTMIVTDQYQFVRPLLSEKNKGVKK